MEIISDDFINNKQKILQEQIETLELAKGGGVLVIPQEQIDKEMAIFRECYDLIIDNLKFYVDIQEEYYPIIALWILGTYVHDEFETFPLLFINATKGSGKSRLLKLISALSRNGKIVLDLKEAVLFRTAKDHTICIDEFERVGGKENNTMRTMINASYKKGASVERMKKVVKNGREEQVVERFDLYTPVAMANIWGMEDVLADRCIQIILEKSNNPVIVKLIEDFDTNNQILALKSSLNQIQCSLCMNIGQKNIIRRWNEYVSDGVFTPKLHLIHTIHTLHKTTQTTPIREDLSKLSLFNKIKEIGIDGRNLELFFPLFIIADLIGEDKLNELLEITKRIIKEKKEDEFAESKDVSLIDFISKSERYRNNFIPVYQIWVDFKQNTMEDPEQEKWINPHWIGRALKRTKLIIQKRRVTKGIEVILDIDKAKTLLLRFKEVKDDKTS